MKAFVTGGSGLVGANLIRELSKQGWAINALVRKNSNLKALEGLKIKKIQEDILDTESLEIGMAGSDVVFHSAAMVSMWTASFDRMHSVNVDGTINVMRAALKTGVKRVIHVSTVDAIGFNTPEGWGSIKKPSHEGIPGPNNWAKIPYMVTKWQAQEAVLRFFREEGLEVIVVNPTFMLGPYDLKPSSGTMIIEIARGIMKGYTTGGNNFIHVQDVIEAMITAVQKGQPGELYILGNQNLFYKEILSKVADIVGKPAPKLRIPKPLALTAGFLGSAAGHLFRLTGFKPEKINLSTAKMAYIQHFFDSSKAIEKLELKQTPIETAIADAYRWFINNKYLS